MTIHEPSATGTDRERLVLMLAYGLYLLAIANGVTLLIGFVIALARRDEAKGSIYEGHYRNLILVFFASMAFAALMGMAILAGLLGLLSAAFDLNSWPFAWWFPVPVLLVPVAVLGSILFGVWYLWRVIGGFFRALEEKPY
jgi:uncharacterized membrane protein